MFVWGPDLVGGAIAIGSVTGAVALGLAVHYVAMTPLIAVAVVAFFATCFGDMLDDGPRDRRRALEAQPCAHCVSYRRQLDDANKDRDELREALATLSLPPEPGR